MKKVKIMVSVFIIAFLVALVSYAWIFKPPQDRAVNVGYIINTRTGETCDIYAIKEIHFSWKDYTHLQVRLVLPKRDAHDRTTVVLYVK